MNRKTFETEYEARKWAIKVNGTVKMMDLPDYMGVVTVWVVEWED